MQIGVWFWYHACFFISSTLSRLSGSVTRTFCKSSLASSETNFGIVKSPARIFLYKFAVLGSFSDEYFLVPQMVRTHKSMHRESHHNSICLHQILNTSFLLSSTILESLMMYLRCSIAWRSTCSLQCLTIFVGITQSKVNYFDVLVVV